MPDGFCTHGSEEQGDADTSTTGRRQKNYGDRWDEYAAEGSLAYCGDMLVKYCVQERILTTRGTVTAALHRTMDQRSSLFRVVRLAQAKGQTCRARTALYEK